jgi:hypothetical protein
MFVLKSRDKYSYLVQGHMLNKQINIRLNFIFQEDLIYICQIFWDHNILRCHNKNLITNNAEFNMFNTKLQIQ